MVIVAGELNNMIMHGRRVRLGDGRIGRISNVISASSKNSVETWVVSVDNGGLVPTTPGGCELLDKPDQKEIKSKAKKIQ